VWILYFFYNITVIFCKKPYIFYEMTVIFCKTTVYFFGINCWAL